MYLIENLVLDQAWYLSAEGQKASQKISQSSRRKKNYIMGSQVCILSFIFLPGVLAAHTPHPNHRKVLNKRFSKILHLYYNNIQISNQTEKTHIMECQ